jgi:hypothetical protein
LWFRNFSVIFLIQFTSDICCSFQRGLLWPKKLCI